MSGCRHYELTAPGLKTKNFNCRSLYASFSHSWVQEYFFHRNLTLYYLDSYFSLVVGGAFLVSCLWVQRSVLASAAAGASASVAGADWCAALQWAQVCPSSVPPTCPCGASALHMPWRPRYQARAYYE